jgi:hypothetical protein
LNDPRLDVIQLSIPTADTAFTSLGRMILIGLLLQHLLHDFTSYRIPQFRRLIFQLLEQNRATPGGPSPPIELPPNLLRNFPNLQPHFTADGHP